MSSSNDDLYSVLPTRFFVGVGATVAVFLDNFPGQKSLTVKYMNGGTLEILPASVGASFVQGTSTIGTPFSAGSTQSLAMLAALSGTGYLMGTSEVLTFDGPTRMYLSATSATTTVCIIRGLSAGN